jgi:hypothetical protein
MKGYRIGGCHKVTLIEYDDTETPDENGRRPSDRLLGMTRTEEDALFIVNSLTLADSARRAWGME